MTSSNVTKKRIRAFSLIELSIVLIIIGLIVGGFLAGTALVKNAELRAIMTEAREYSVAVRAFFAQYDALPGDSTRDYTNSGYTGNDNGKIEYQSKSCDTATDLNLCKKQASEAFSAVYTLGKLGILDKKYPQNTNLTAFGEIGSTNSSTDLLPQSHYPQSKKSTLGWSFDNITIKGMEKNVVFLAKSLPVFPANCQISGSTGERCGVRKHINNSGDVISSGYDNPNNQTISRYKGITPHDAKLIDEKIDNGWPENGYVVATNFVPTGDTTYQYSCYNPDTKEYNQTKKDNESCIIASVIDFK